MGKNWKTTIVGLLTGLVVGGDAILNALQAGTLDGKSGMQLVLGILFALFGAFAKDYNVTGK